MGPVWALNPPRNCPKCGKRVKAFFINLNLDQVVMCENLKCDWPFKDINGSIILGKVDNARKSEGQEASKTATKIATGAIEAATVRELRAEQAARSKDNVDPLKLDNKESVKEETEKVKAGGKRREGKEIGGLSLVEKQVPNKAIKERVKGESDDVRKKKKRSKERLYEAYKGFENVMVKKEIAGKSGQGKSFNQFTVDHDTLNKMEKVERVKVIEKKEKRGGEKFDKEFVRNGHQVSKVMKKVEKNNKKMEKLALKKEGFAPIVPHGEQRFDAHFYQPEAGEGKLGVETMLAGCASVAVKKAEVPNEEADVLSKLLAELAGASETNVFHEPVAKDTAIELASDSTIDELMNSPRSHQHSCNNAGSEMAEDARLVKCMEDFDPEAFLNSIDSI